MSETANISAMAEILSGQLFNIFGWGSFGPANFNFKDDTVKGARKKHPCDIIFGLKDPYHNMIYLLTDLKSYKKSSVKSKDKIQDAITNLAETLSCARKSGNFQRHLTGGQGNTEALLFIFNNDDEFDSDFGSLLVSKGPATVNVPFNARLYIFGPPQIQFLADIANDLEKIHGTDAASGAFSFFYPNMINRIPEKNEWPAASPEMLLSPFLVVLFKKNVKQENNGETIITEQKLTNIYYRGKGETPEEFCFLIDYCFRYSLIDDYKKIYIKMPYACEDYKSHFETACSMFREQFYKGEGLAKLSNISPEGIHGIVIKFHANAIGMDKRKEFSNVVES